MTFLASAPSLKMIRVGMERTWYCAAVTWFSSTLSLTMRTSSRSLAISSRTGATTRHGPHHGAQKSTRTGVSDSSTSAWKVVSVTWLMSAIGCLAPLGYFKKYSAQWYGRQMLRRTLILASCAGFLLLPATADAMIQIDKGIAGARLGNTKAQVRAALGAPAKVTTGTNDFGPFTEFRYRGGLRVTFLG